MRYHPHVTCAAKLLADAVELLDTERAELAAQLLDSVELPPGISLDDETEIRRRAQQAGDGAAGIPWTDVM